MNNKHRENFAKQKNYLTKFSWKSTELYSNPKIHKRNTISSQKCN